jgi:hypothetical protein
MNAGCRLDPEYMGFVFAWVPDWEYCDNNDNDDNNDNNDNNTKRCLGPAVSFEDTGFSRATVSFSRILAMN